MENCTQHVQCIVLNKRGNIVPLSKIHADFFQAPLKEQKIGMFQDQSRQKSQAQSYF